jgi:hypothetical protein
MPLQIRRGTEAERQSLAQTPQSGELIYVTDTEQLYVGDGFTLLRDLSPITGYTDENAVDALGSVFTVSAHSGISFTYNDVANTINAVVSQPSLLQNLNLNNFSITGTGNINIIGNITVNGKLDADFNGSIYGDDSTILVDGVDNKINLDGTVKGNIIPVDNEAYDIGSAAKKFKDLYLKGTSIYLGNATITNPSSTIVNLPAGSTVGGNVILASDPNGGQDYAVLDIQGSVFGDDSVKLIDAVESKIVGPILNETINTGLITIGEDLAAGGLVINTNSSLDDDYSLFNINSFHNDAISSGMSLNRARGSFASPAALQTNDEIFSIIFGGTGGDAQGHLAGRILVGVDGALAGGGAIIPGKISLFTVDNTDTERLGLSIDSNQLIGVSDNNVTTANSGVGTADVAAGVATYLKIKIGATTYAIPAYGLVT